MSRINLTEDRTSKVFDMIKQIVGQQGFTFDPDLSETDIGRQNQEFVIRPTEAISTPRSGGQVLQVRQTYIIELKFNAENSTEQGLKKAMRSVVEVAHALERFAPEPPLDALRNTIIAGTFVVRWNFETLKDGEDSRLKANIEFEAEYRIPRE